MLLVLARKKIDLPPFLCTFPNTDLLYVVTQDKDPMSKVRKLASSAEIQPKVCEIVSFVKNMTSLAMLLATKSTVMSPPSSAHVERKTNSQNVHRRHISSFHELCIKHCGWRQVKQIGGRRGETNRRTLGFEIESLQSEISDNVTTAMFVTKFG